MMEKVKITREVANGIESVRTGFEDARIIEIHSQFPNAWSGPSATNLNGLPLLTLVDALRIGYEVEEEYKVGDWVVYKSAQKGLIICKVESVSGVKVDTDYVASNGYKQSFGKSQIRHATPEEIKAEQERRVWAGIGREVREFRDGDVGVSYSESIWTELSSLRTLHDSDDLKGFYPAESFISFRGESHDN